MIVRLRSAELPCSRNAALLRFPAPEFGLPPRYPDASKGLRSNHLTISAEMLYFVCSAGVSDRTSNSLKSSCPVPLLSGRRVASVSLFESTLANSLVSVGDKGLTGNLSLLDSTLTKNRGVAGVMVKIGPGSSGPKQGITGTLRPRKEPSLPLAPPACSRMAANSRRIILRKEPNHVRTPHPWPRSRL